MILFWWSIFLFFCFSASCSAEAPPVHQSLSQGRVEVLEPECKKVHPPTSIHLKDGRTVDAPPYLNGKLPPFWAQEYVGADLARDFLKQKIGLRTVRVGLIDSGSKNYFSESSLTPDARFSELKGGFKLDHGSMVASLINGETPIGASETARLSLVILNYGDEGDEVGQKSFDLVKESPPEIMNASLSFFNREADRKPKITSQSLEPIARRTVLVKSAGNGYPREISGVEGAIFVGSISPLGFPSGYSQDGPNVDVVAPADEFVTSLKSTIISTPPEVRRQMPHPFGKTSAAVPMVTGALSNVLALVPGLSTNELRILLRKSAVALPGVVYSAGMLNSYKLVRIADRLRENKSFIQSTNESYRRQVLSAPDLYDFSAEASDLMSSIKLDQDSKTTEDTLRRAFLLNPGDHRVRIALASQFQCSHTKYNALFLNSFDSNDGLNKAIDAGLEDKDPNLKASAVRALAKLGPQGKPKFEKMMQALLSEQSFPPGQALPQAIIGTARSIYADAGANNALGSHSIEILSKLVEKGASTWELFQALIHIPEKEKGLIMERLISVRSKIYDPIREALIQMQPVGPKTLELLISKGSERVREGVLELFEELSRAKEEDIDWKMYQSILESLKNSFPDGYKKTKSQELIRQLSLKSK
jgi:formate dehydrogenase maturation protein FdhE